MALAMEGEANAHTSKAVKNRAMLVGRAAAPEDLRLEQTRRVL